MSNFKMLAPCLLVCIGAALLAQGTEPDHLSTTWSNFNNASLPDSLRLEAAKQLQIHYQSFNADTLRLINQQMLTHGRKQADAQWQAYALKSMGGYHMLTSGNIDSAKWYCRAAMQLSANLDGELYPKLVQNMGVIHYYDNQPDSALTYFLEALPLAEARGLQTLVGTTSNSIGVIYQNQQAYVRALQYFERALQYSTPEEQVSIEVNIARIFENYGMLDLAGEHSRKALALAEQTGVPDKLLSAYNMMIANGETNPKGVDEWIKKAEALARKHDNYIKLCQMYTIAGHRYLNQYKDLEKADYYTQQAIQLANTYERPFLAIQPRIDLADIRLQQGRLQEALALIRENQPIMSTKGVEIFSVAYNLIASEVFEKMGQLDSAFHYLKKLDIRTLTEQGKSIGMNRAEMVGYMDFLHKQKEETLQREKAAAEAIAIETRRREQANYRLFGALGLLLVGIATAFFFFFRQKQRAADQLALANTALLTEQDKLRRTNAQLQRFSSVVSHDLLSSLNLILSANTVWVGAQPRKENLLRYHEMAHRVARRMKDYCQNLLDEARREVAISPQTPEPTNPMPILQNVLASFEHPLREAQFDVQVAPLSSSTLPAPIQEQVFQNLIANAIHHGATHAQPILRISEEKNPQGISQWIVEDNGPGIDPQAREVIFQFGNADGHAVGQKMGLSLLRDSLRDYGRDIRAEERAGGGAQFVIAPV